jgi:hypothetical protein
MELAKRQKLEAAGWKVTTVAEFLDLSPEEMDLIEIRLSLSKLLKQFREQQKLADNVTPFPLEEYRKDIITKEKRKR